jgi:phosphatidylglycerol:prolipoprotein diacylglycerol transferase
MYLPYITIWDLQISTWLVLGYGNILAVSILFVILAYRRGSDLVTILTLMLLYFLGSAIGVLVIPSIIGALVGGIIFFVIGKWLLNVSEPLSDIYAIVTAILIGVGRIGCFVNGCCFGTETRLPWGVTYPTGTSAHWLHFHTSRLSSMWDSSLAVHPIQLYEAVLMVIAVPIMVWASRRVRNKISILLGFMGIYLLFRAGVEHYRDTINIWWSLVDVGPISVFQVASIITGLVLSTAAFFVRNLKWSANSTPQTHRLTKSTILITASYIIALSLLPRFQAILVVFIVLLLGLNIITAAYAIMTNRAWGRLKQAVILSTLGIFAIVPFIGDLQAKFSYVDLQHAQSINRKT